MAAKPRKTVSRKTAGAKSAAAAERPKETGKASFGKATPKTVKPAIAAKPAKAAKSAGPSMAARVMRKVKATASGAVELAASVVGKGSRKAKAK